MVRGYGGANDLLKAAYQLNKPQAADKASSRQSKKHIN
jgi:hypothetical protein